MNEQIQDMAEELDAIEQAMAESEMELQFQIREAIDMAINLKLPRDMVEILCYATGVPSNEFYED